MNTSDTLQVARTIADQIGHRAFVMMGTRMRSGDESSLTFDVRGSAKANRVKVTLDRATDTYTVECYRVRRVSADLVSSFTGIQSDNLNACIESATGLRLSL